MAQHDSLLLLEPAAYRVMPWKNGGGTTREIFVQGDGADFDWRLSIADVAADGPFSPFPGHARSIMLLDGRGMELRFGDARTVRIDTRYRPVDFDGGANTHCTLIDGAVRDFNIMSARDRVRHEHKVIARFPHVAAPRERTLARALFGIKGEIGVRIHGRSITLAHEATVIAFYNTPLEIHATAGGLALLVHFLEAPAAAPGS